MRIERLPLPEPWTIQTLSHYVDALTAFITKYHAIACFNSSEIFTKGFAVDWNVPNYSVQQWLRIVQGEEPPDALESFADFLRFSRRLPLKDVPDLSNLGRKHRQRASLKKNHELDVMLSFLNTVKTAHSITTSNAMDVGAGVGLLSTELSTAGYNVVAVEGNPKYYAELVKNSSFRSVNKFVVRPTDLDIIQEPCISMSLRNRIILILLTLRRLRQLVS